MTEKWIVIFAGTLVFLVVFRWIKGNWGEAIIGAILAPLIMAFLFAVALIPFTMLGKWIAPIFRMAHEQERFTENFGFWGAAFVAFTICILYCAQAYRIARITAAGPLYGGASSGHGGSAKGHWRNESPKIFRRTFGK